MARKWRDIRNARFSKEHRDEVDEKVREACMTKHKYITIRRRGEDKTWTFKLHHHLASNWDEMFCPPIKIGDVVAVSAHIQNSDKEAGNKVWEYYASRPWDFELVEMRDDVRAEIDSNAFDLEHKSGVASMVRRQVLRRRLFDQAELEQHDPCEDDRCPILDCSINRQLEEVKKIIEFKNGPIFTTPAEVLVPEKEKGVNKLCEECDFIDGQEQSNEEETNDQFIKSAKLIAQKVMGVFSRISLFHSRILTDYDDNRALVKEAEYCYEKISKSMDSIAEWFDHVIFGDSVSNSNFKAPPSEKERTEKLNFHSPICALGHYAKDEISTGKLFDILCEKWGFERDNLRVLTKFQHHGEECLCHGNKKQERAHGNCHKCSRPVTDGNICNQNPLECADCWKKRSPFDCMKVLVKEEIERAKDALPKESAKEMMSDAIKTLKGIASSFPPDVHYVPLAIYDCANAIERLLAREHKLDEARKIVDDFYSFTKAYLCLPAENPAYVFNAMKKLKELLGE